MGTVWFLFYFQFSWEIQETDIPIAGAPPPYSATQQQQPQVVYVQQQPQQPQEADLN